MKRRKDVMRDYEIGISDERDIESRVRLSSKCSEFCRV